MSTVDLSNCDREPVGFITSVQSFGAILGVDAETNVITHASSNIIDYLGESAEILLGKNIQKIMPYQNDIQVREVSSSNSRILEFVRSLKESKLSQREFLDELEYLQNASDLKSLVDRIAQVIFSETGMDRTLVYKFDEKLDGEVVAERTNPGVDSFLGLHYPASDIPDPARQIFLSTWLRVIPDREGKTYPILTNGVRALDLTSSLLRAVSPIHLEYLKNMNVAASVTISLKVNGKLWGLITSSHLTPKILSNSQMEMCELIGRFSSALIYEVERKVEDAYRKIQETVYAKLMNNLHKGHNFPQELTRSSPNLLDLIESSGVAIATSNEKEWITVGQTPDQEQLNSLTLWLSQQEKASEIFVTDNLSAYYPKASEIHEIASGLLSLKIPTTDKNYILWFRKEYVRSVSWGGKPDVKVNVNGRISPRTSFAAWKETVKGKSHHWNLWEIESAHKLRNDFITLNLKRQFVSEQLARQEAQQAVKFREELISAVSHDLKNPLTSMQINAKLLERQLPPENEKLKSLSQRIQRSVDMMNSLIDDILNITKIETGNFHLSLINQNIELVLKEACDILEPIAKSKGVHFEFKPFRKCYLRFDFALILQLLSHLVGNAIKFTEKGGKIVVEVTEPNPDEIQVSVSDTGPGIPVSNLSHVFDRFWQAKQSSKLGTGLGLAIAKGIASAHNGKIWVESELTKGSTFFFTLPKN